MNDLKKELKSILFKEKINKINKFTFFLVSIIFICVIFIGINYFISVFYKEFKTERDTKKVAFFKKTKLEELNLEKAYEFTTYSLEIPEELILDKNQWVYFYKNIPEKLKKTYENKKIIYGILNLKEAELIRDKLIENKIISLENLSTGAISLIKNPLIELGER